MLIDSMRDEFAKVESAIADGPILPAVTAKEIREYLASRYDFARGMDLETVVADVEEMLRKWQVQVTHPRYFGLFNPSVMLASVVADTLVAMYNSQLANWRTSPAANEIEQIALIEQFAIHFRRGKKRNYVGAGVPTACEGNRP